MQVRFNCCLINASLKFEGLTDPSFCDTEFSDNLHISFWSYARGIFITKFGMEKSEAQANNTPWEF